MRTFLLFIGSVLYPVVMVIISPILAFLYVLLGLTIFTRFVNAKRHQLVDLLVSLKLPVLQLLAKKQLVFRPKAVRLH